MAYKDIIEAIQGSGRLTLEQVKNIVEIVFISQTTLHNMDEDDAREAIEEAIEEEE